MLHDLRSARVTTGVTAAPFPARRGPLPFREPPDRLVISLAVPKRKTSRQRRDTRRATHAIEATRMGRCPRCSSPVRTHHVCGVCGYYRGRPVVEIEG
jgi:large subunit ribosomal protein L32